MLALLLTVALSQAPTRVGDGRLHVYFFDVGHGDSVLIVSPVGRTVLIDGGPLEAQNHLRLRLPSLVKSGQGIDLAVLSTPSAEHLGGLAAAIGQVGARRVLDVGSKKPGDAHALFLRQLQEAGVQVVIPVPDPNAPGDIVRIGLGGDAELEVLWPRAPAEPLFGGARGPAANSIVLRAVYGNTSAIFMSDAQPETEAMLLKRKPELESTLLHVSQHGNEAGSSLPFLVAVKPLAGIVSVGRGNPVNAPARAALNRLAQIGARVFRTDLDGEIHAVSDGQRFTVTTEKLPAGESKGLFWSFPALPGTMVASALPPPRQPPRMPIPRKQPPAKAPVLELDSAAAPPLRTFKLPKRAPATSPSVLKDDDGPDDFDEPVRQVVVVEDDAPKGPLTPLSVPTTVVDDDTMSLFVGKKGGTEFHRPECPTARRLGGSERVIFPTRGDAKRAMKPARDCRP